MRKLSSRVLGPVIAVVLLAGCGSSSSSSSSSGAGASAASKVRFCADNAKLDKATSSATSLKGLLVALTGNLGTIEDFAKTAPGVIEAQAKTLVAGATAALKSGNASAFASSSFANAGKAVDSFCAHSSGGATTSTTS